MYRSPNDGGFWIKSDKGLKNSAYLNSITHSGKNLYAATQGEGVFISNDYGRSWDSINTGLTNRNIYSFAVIGTNLFAGTAIGVFRSTNNGIILGSRKF